MSFHEAIMRLMDALLLFSLPRVNGLMMGKITNLIVECGIANWEFFKIFRSSAKRAQSHLLIVKHNS